MPQRMTQRIEATDYGHTWQHNGPQRHTVSTKRKRTSYEHNTIYANQYTQTNIHFFF